MLRFRLKTLLVCVTLICVALGYLVSTRLTAHRKIQKLTAVFGTMLGEPQPRDFLDRWLGIATHESIYEVSFGELQSDDDLLSSLRMFHGLETLYFCEVSLSEENLKAIPTLPNVKKLEIDDWQQNEFTLAELRLLLSRFPFLQEVKFQECHHLNDELLRSLPSSLQTIEIEKCKNVSGEFLDGANKWPDLETIYLEWVPINAATIDALAKYKQLDTAWLTTSVPDDGNCDFFHLASSVKINRLALWGFGIDAETEMKLKQQFPDVRWIIRD